MAAPGKDNIQNLKAVEETNSLGSKKKNKKGKLNAGDQVSVEIEKNDNQSNTLLGRNTNEKYEEEIQNLVKQLDDLQNEKTKSENTLKEKVLLLQVHENRNEDLNGEIKNLLLKLNKMKSDMESEKVKSNQLSVDKSKVSKEIEEIKSQMIIDNTAHKDMYMKYENKIEDLLDQVKKYKLEEVKLNKELTGEIKKSKEIQQKYNEVNEILSKRLEELKVKEGDILKCQEMNQVLKKTVEDLEKSFYNKTEEFQKRHLIESEENNRLKVVVEELKVNLRNKDCELEESVKSETNLIEQASDLNETIQNIKKEFIIMESDYKTKVNNLNESNESLQIKVNELQKEIESKIKYEKNLAEAYEEKLQLQTNSLQGQEEIKALFALKENELLTKCKVLEEQNNETECSIKALETTIHIKDREIEQLTSSKADHEEMITYLNNTLDDLKRKFSLVEESSKHQFIENDQKTSDLRETIYTLQKETDSKVKELEEIKKREVLLLDQVSSIPSLTEQLQKTATLKEDFDRKLKELNEHNTHLQIIIHDLKKEMEEKIIEIDSLREQNLCLSSKLSSVNVEFDVLRQHSSKEEKSFAMDNKTDELFVKELNGKIELLSKELASLKIDLGKKEVQVEDLLVNASVLLSEKKSLEKNLNGIIEKLQTQIIKLMDENKMLENDRSNINVINEEIIPEIKVQPSNESPANIPEYHSQYIFEVENLKYHIKKLENELVQMQGRYFQLKEDSINVINGAKQPSQNIISETVSVSIPPVTVDNSFQSTVQMDENRASTHDSLQEAINRLNSEIEEQRLTNQKLSGDLQSKQSEVNNLKQCLFGLDGSLNNIGDMANELQKTCSLTNVEKNNMKCQHDSLIKDHEILTKRYVDLEERWNQLNKSLASRSIDNDQDQGLENKMNILYKENHDLKLQLEQYRDSLERTEHMLEKIQCSVDKEEAQWTEALNSSEQDNSRLELTVKELTMEIHELKNKSLVDLSDTIASISTINNGTVASETKKKRKRKNKNKKKKKNLGVPEPNGS